MIINRKGTNGVSTHGVAADIMIFDRGTFWVLTLTYFYLPKVPGRTSFPNLSKLITFAAAPLVLTPFVRDQGLSVALLEKGAVGGGVSAGNTGIACTLLDVPRGGATKPAAIFRRYLGWVC